VAVATLTVGAFDYIMKPVDLNRLRDVLATAILIKGKSRQAPLTEGEG
jgi:FixJ family two-component response regulator